MSSSQFTKPFCSAGKKAVRVTKATSKGTSQWIQRAAEAETIEPYPDGPAFIVAWAGSGGCRRNRSRQDVAAASGLRRLSLWPIGQRFRGFVRRLRGADSTPRGGFDIVPFAQDKFLTRLASKRNFVVMQEKARHSRKM